MSEAPRRQISPERKGLYYAGMALMVIGLILFLSTFVTFLLNFGNFNNFESQAISNGLRAFGGIVLQIIGGIMMNIGARGVAGSGVILDPEKARKDVEPWSRMGGGIMSDALDEVGVVKKFEQKIDAPPQIKIRCRGCQALNDETAKFCSQCGAGM